MDDRFLPSGPRSYPALPSGKRVFSLPRLKAFLESQEPQSIAKDSELWLGGELQYASSKELAEGQFWLCDQGLRLSFLLGHFPAEAQWAPEDFRPGDRVMLKLESFWGLKEALGEGHNKPLHQASFLTRLCPRKRESMDSLPWAGAPATTVTVERLQVWQEFLIILGEFFKGRGLAQVASPSLVVSPGFEPSLEPFFTSFRVPGQDCRPLFLPTSPEIHLKKMLAQGWTDIFEIRSCYRNGELSDHHEPEFTLLEWYRAYANLDLIAQDLQELFQFLGNRGWIKGLSPKEPFPLIQSISVSELFDQYVGLELQPDTPYSELYRRALELRLLGEKGQGLRNSEWAWDDLFHLLFLTQIEPQLQEQGPLLVKDYPPSQSALSRINDRGWAERMELYWRGLELANAFDELNSPQEQLHRYERDCQERQRLGTTEVPLDQEFLQSVERGIPPTGGIALGVERFFMACQGVKKIQEVKGFSYSRSGWLRD